METFFTMIILDHSPQSHLSLSDSRDTQCDWLDSRMKSFINSLVSVLETSFFFFLLSKGRKILPVLKICKCRKYLPVNVFSRQHIL